MIDFKWNAFARTMFLRDLGLSLIYAVTFTIQAVGYEGSTTAENEDEQKGAFAALIITGVLWGYFLYHEIATSFGNAENVTEALATIPRFFVGDGTWDRLQRASLVAVAATTISDLNADFPRAAVAASFALPLVYMNLLYFMQGFKVTGTLVRMVVQITLAVRWFVVILLVVLAGFSLSFYVLYKAGSGLIDLPSVVVDDATEYLVQDKVYGYDTWYSSFLPGFALMLGAFDLQDFESSGDKDVMALLFTTFQFFANIVMLNLLIAIMSDQYDIVQESGHEQYLYAKAGIILEVTNGVRGQRCHLSFAFGAAADPPLPERPG